MFKGKIWKDKNYWLVEVSALDLMTQGKTKKEALEMIQDAISALLNKKIKLDLPVVKDGSFAISSKDINALFSLFLKRQRMKHGLTIREVTKKMKAASPTAYAQYESGKVSPSIGQIQKLLQVVGASKDGFELKVALD